MNGTGQCTGETIRNGSVILSMIVIMQSNQRMDVKNEQKAKTKKKKQKNREKIVSKGNCTVRFFFF